MMNIEEFNNLSSYQQQAAFEAITFSYWVKRSLLGTAVIVIALMSGCPIYNVWQQGLSGEAELAKAVQNRQIKVEEALAIKESATYKKDAEVIRAEGVQKANEIIAGGLGGPEGYLRYLYIDALNEGKCSTVYIATEAGLPIMEAVRGIKH